MSRGSGLRAPNSSFRLPEGSESCKMSILDFKEIGMEYKELLTEFGKACGLDDMRFDDENVTVIQADDIQLSFMEVPATRRLAMFADVAEKPHDGCERLYETLLEAQHLGMATGGAIFSISPNGTISLYRQDPLVDLDVALLSKIVEDFLNLIDRWRELIAAYRPDVSLERDKTPAEDFALGSSDFMQV